jgi:hypothetical protein
MLLAAASISGERVNQAKIDLSIGFDGGYIYNLNGDKFVEVKTLKKGLHPMRIRILEGTSDLGISEFRLMDATLELLPDGAAPQRAMPKLPPLDLAQTDCDPKRDQKSPNNLLFLPNLGVVAGEMGTTLKRGGSGSKKEPDSAGGIVLTGGGELKIREVGGCVEFRRPNGTVFGKPRSMASGVDGVRYEWPTNGQSLTLRITSDGGKVTNIVVVPSSNNRIRLGVGSFDAPPALAPAPYKLAHFTSFDDAFSAVDETKRLSLFWTQSYSKSPGIDCPSGGDPEPWPWP